MESRRSVFRGFENGGHADYFPFAAFAIAVIAEKLWSYFEDNRY